MRSVSEVTAVAWKVLVRESVVFNVLNEYDNRTRPHIIS
jgi:hypothetical protein